VGVLADDEFLAHQGLLGSGFAAIKLAGTYVESGFQLVVDSSDVEVELDLLDAYFVNVQSLEEESAASLLGLATRALHRHVRSRTQQAFNDFLFTRGLKVTQDFADLSALNGVPIRPENIQ
jgi:hypothetical protein